MFIDTYFKNNKIELNNRTSIFYPINSPIANLKSLYVRCLRLSLYLPYVVLKMIILY
jgi:hypothetical protein